MSLLQIIWFSVFSAIYAHDSTNLTDNGLSSRILYGKRANINDYPYFAGIDGCGAAIISDQWLVTAAHCFDSGIIDNSVWVGGESIENSQRYEFDKVIIHPYYTSIQNSIISYVFNDIALLRLSRPLTFGSTVKTIALPHREYQRNAVHKFAGRGRDETRKGTEHLMRVNLRTLERKECLSYLSAAGRRDPHLMWLKKVIICTKRIQDKPGLCFGDSGSPLVQNETLVGIASFIQGKTCHSSRLAMFTNVAPFVSWIKSLTGIN